MWSLSLFSYRLERSRVPYGTWSPTKVQGVKLLCRVLPPKFLQNAEFLFQDFLRGRPVQKFPFGGSDRCWVRAGRGHGAFGHHWIIHTSYFWQKPPALCRGHPGYWPSWMLFVGTLRTGRLPPKLVGGLCCAWAPLHSDEKRLQAHPPPPAIIRSLFLSPPLVVVPKIADLM